ncbi:unnamed protein product [Caenorhabditis nigoni]
MESQTFISPNGFLNQIFSEIPGFLLFSHMEDLEVLMSWLIVGSQQSLFRYLGINTEMRTSDLLLNQPLKPKDLVTKYVEFVAKYGPFPEMDPYGRKLNFFQRHLLDIEKNGRLADTLTEKGHNVTYLMPVVDVEKRDECIGVKLTKDLIIVEAGEEMLTQKTSDTSSDEIMEVFWKAEMDSSNSREMFRWFSSDMKIACRNFLRRRDIFSQMKSRNFDLAVLEPVSVCGLGFVKALGIEKIILASSCTFFDTVLPYIGEPLDFSYVPAGFSVTGDVMSISERYENWLVTKEINAAFEDMHDGETEIYKEFLGENIPDWRDLLPSASIFFVNSNPFLDFPRPVLQKTIPIGGISVNMKWTTEHQISSEWEQILNKRTSNVLISFGSMVKSTHMPLKWRNGLLETIKSMPNVTFIWKYESENVSFADGINNLHFSKWVPQITLLSDSRLTAFVSHGGLGSTMELAYSGKPAVVIPVFADQIRNANMLARHKGAIYLHKNHMENVEIVRKAFEDVLFDESYKKNAAKLAKILNNQPYSPKENVIKYTEFVGEHGPFPSMDPYGRHHNFFQKLIMSLNISNVQSSSRGEVSNSSAQSREKILDDARRAVDESYQKFEKAHEGVYGLQYELLAAYDQVEAFEAKIGEGGNNSTLRKLQKQLRAAEIEVQKVQHYLDVAVIEKRKLYEKMEAEELKYEWIKSVYGSKNDNVGTY